MNTIPQTFTMVDSQMEHRKLRDEIAQSIIVYLTTSKAPDISLVSAQVQAYLRIDAELSHGHGGLP